MRLVRVLLVEDEALVRSVGVDVLEEAGYAVVEAANAKEALAKLDSHPDVKVLFTDIDMPGDLNGIELARCVHAKRPDMKLLVTSGKLRPSDKDLPDDGRFIAKPYLPSELAEMVSSPTTPNDLTAMITPSL